MADEKMKWEDRSKVVDLSTPGLLAGEVVDINFAADAWAAPIPPPMGLYALKLFPGKEFVRQVLRDESKGWDAPGNVFYRANLECRIVAPGKDYDNTPVFASVSSIVGRGREISVMMGLILLTGAKPKKSSLSDLEQAKILQAVLVKEPIIRDVFLDWDGYSKNDEKSVCKSMVDFPKQQDGTYSHIFTRTDSNRDKEEIVGQLRVKVWNGKNAAVPSSQATVAETVRPSAPSAATAPAPVADRDLNDLLA